MMMSGGMAPINFSDLREMVRKSSIAPASAPTATSGTIATRNKWPSSYVDYDAAAPLEAFLPRGMSLMNHVRKECKQLNERMESNDSRVSSTKDTERNMFAVHASAEIPSTIPIVLQTLCGPTGDHFDAFLGRMLGEKLEHSDVHRSIGVDVHGQPWKEPLFAPPRMVSIGSFYYDDSTLFKKFTKEVFYVDYMHIHSNMRAVTRVVKTIDGNTQDVHRHVERIRHVLFGFALESIQHEDDSGHHVRLSFYGEFCLGVDESNKYMRDAKHLLEKIGSSVQLLQRLLASKANDSKWCRSCLRSFSLFRQSAFCSACGQSFCYDCVAKDEVTIPSGATFEVRLCASCGCKNDPTLARACTTPQRANRSLSQSSSTSTPRASSASVSSIEEAASVRCVKCRKRSALASCQVCRAKFCRGCCKIESSAAASKSGILFESWTCSSCHSSASQSLQEGSHLQVGFADQRPSELYNYLLRISEGNEIDHQSPQIEQVPRSPSSTPLVSPVALPHEILQPECELPPRVDADLIRTTAVLDLETNDALDAICLQAATRMECAYAFVNLIYKGSFMLKGAAAVNQPVPTSIPRDCPLSTQSSKLPLFVPDAEMDPRFALSPLVAGREHIRFYYGLPLVTASGVLLGTVAVADRHPRVRLSSSQRHELLDFAHESAMLIMRRL